MLKLEADWSDTVVKVYFQPVHSGHSQSIRDSAGEYTCLPRPSICLVCLCLPVSDVTRYFSSDLLRILSVKWPSFKLSCLVKFRPCFLSHTRWNLWWSEVISVHNRTGYQPWLRYFLLYTMIPPRWQHLIWT